MRTRARQLADKPLKVVFRGVCRQEVETFVAEATQDYHAVLADIERMRRELAEVTATLVSAHAGERETTRTISQAETDARGIREAAERQAADLQRAAEAKTDVLLRDLEAEREQISRQMVRCAESRARLTRILQTEIDELGLLITPRSPSPGRTVSASTPGIAPPRAVAVPVPVASVALEAVSFEQGTAHNAAIVDESPDDIPVREPDEAWSSEDVESALRALIDTIPSVQVPEPLVQEAGVPPDSPQPDEEIRGIAADPRYVAAAADEARESSLVSGRASTQRYLPRMAWGAGALAAVIAVLVAFPRTPTDAATPVESVSPAPIAHQQPTLAPALRAATTPATPAPEITSAAASPSNTLVVRMQAIRPCWISVTIDGEKEARLLGQGEEITRESASDLILRVGDAGALVVTVNDRRLPPLGRDGEVVTRRFTRN